MDDLAFSVNYEKCAVKTKDEIHTILSSGSFKVKGWHSNLNTVDEFPDSDVTDVLGHLWNKSEDKFKLKFSTLTLPETLTKRTILSTIAKLWDPLGILAPVTLSLRILMQSLWSVQLSWDDPVDCTTRTELKKQFEDINCLQDFWIDRCIKPNCNSGPFELHGFCDAGEKAYGAVVWMRCLTSDDQ